MSEYTYVKIDPNTRRLLKIWQDEIEGEPHDITEIP